MGYGYLMSLTEFIYTVLLRPRPLKLTVNALIRLLVPETIKLRGATIFINPQDPVISGALTLRVYEKDEIAFFVKHFEPDMNMIDIGANVGIYTALALTTKGFEGKLVCLEPCSESMEFLEKTVKINARKNAESVYLSNKAASNVEGTVTLYKNPENKGDNRLYADKLLNEKATIQATTLDKICSQCDIDEVNFIKIDIQGFEKGNHGRSLYHRQIL